MTRDRKKGKPRTFKVWVRVGVGLHAPFLAAVARYRPPETAMNFWKAATLTLDPPKPRKPRT